MPARFVYLSVSAKPSLPTNYKEAPVQAQSLAILPVFCGISGSYKTMFNFVMTTPLKVDYAFKTSFIREVTAVGETLLSLTDVGG